MAYESPGFAASEAITSSLADQQMLRHQHLMDAIALDREKRMAKREVLEEQWALEDREKKKTQDEVSGLIEGVDVPTPELQKRAAKHGIPIRVAPPTAGQQFIPPEGRMDMTTGPMGEQRFPSGAPAPGTLVTQQGIKSREAEQAGRDVEEQKKVEAGKFADVIAGMDPNNKALQGLSGGIRIGMPPALAEKAAALAQGPKPSLTPETGLVVRDAKGKTVPNASVTVDKITGEYRVNGKPVPEGYKVEKVIPPETQLAAAIAKLASAQTDAAKKVDDKKARDQMLQPPEKWEPGSLGDKFTTMLVNNTITLDQLTKEFGFQREGRTFLWNITAEASRRKPEMSFVLRQQLQTALGGALRQTEARFANQRAYSKKTDEVADKLLGVLDKVPDEALRKFNHVARAAVREMGGRDIATFDVYMPSLRADYSRLMMNPNIVGVIAQQARDELGKTLPDDATVDQIRMAIKALKSESLATLKATEEERDTIREDIKKPEDQPKTDDISDRAKALIDKARGGK